jgi:signal transduction histidine kinase
MDASGKVPEPLANRIESIANSSRDLLQTLDEIVWAVNPHNDTLEHLAAYLRQYADEYFQNTSIECEMRLPRTIPHHPLSAEERHNIFLTFEEALNNVLKHSGATKVRILMQIHDHQFMVEISDNGQGFSVPQFTGRNRRSSQTPTERGGNGLLNMCQRMSAIGGEYQIQSQAGSGTTIQMRIRLSSQPGRPGT